MEFLADSGCTAEVPPDDCLRRANGILEMDNPEFNILLFWQFDHVGNAGALHNWVRSHSDNNLKRNCLACYRDNSWFCDFVQSEVDLFYECVKGKLWGWSPPAVAVLPTDTLGQSCRSGWVWELDIQESQFNVRVVVLYA